MVGKSSSKKKKKLPQSKKPEEADQWALARSANPALLFCGWHPSQNLNPSSALQTGQTAVSDLS